MTHYDDFMECLSIIDFHTNQALTCPSDMRKMHIDLIVHYEEKKRLISDAIMAHIEDEVGKYEKGYV